VQQQLAEGKEAEAEQAVRTAREQQLMTQSQTAEPMPEPEIGEPGGMAGQGQ
jgi:hypothetical protein